jgi:hypothetical protein
MRRKVGVHVFTNIAVEALDKLLSKMRRKVGVHFFSSSIGQAAIKDAKESGCPLLQAWAIEFTLLMI